MALPGGSCAVADGTADGALMLLAEEAPPAAAPARSTADLLRRLPYAPPAGIHVPAGYDPDTDPNVAFLRCTARLGNGSREYNLALQHLEAAVRASVPPPQQQRGGGGGQPPTIGREARLQHLVQAIVHEGHSTRLSQAAGCLPHGDPRRHDVAMRAAGLAAFALQPPPPPSAATPREQHHHRSPRRSARAPPLEWSVPLL